MFSCAAQRLVILVMLCPALWASDCIPFTQARDHLGEEQCITGKVLRVKRGSRGTTFFDFCEDFRVCPFTVVVFPGKLKDIGDVRALQNRVIEVHGPVKEYDGRAEIVLDQLRQLGSESALIPKLPKNFDVENKGHFSPGSFSLPGKPYATHAKKHPATLPIEVPDDSGPMAGGTTPP